MAALSFVQTDTAAPLGTIQACSALAVLGAPSTPAARLAAIGGVAGTTPVAMTIGAGHNGSLVMFEMAPNVAIWEPGVHTARLNITTAAASANVTWLRLYCCRVTPAGVVVATLASNTSVSTALNTTGVKSATASQSATSIGEPTDLLYQVLTIRNTDGVDRTFSFTPNQNADSPIFVRTVRVDSPLAVNILNRMNDV